MDDISLARRVQDLPPEIFNLILTWVFTPESVEHGVYPGYKPPKLLAISRYTRELFAQAYYGAEAATFVFDAGPSNPTPDALDWLRSLPPAHRDMLKELKFVWKNNKFSPNKASLFARYLRRSIARALERNGLGLTGGRVLVEIHTKYKSGKEVVGKAWVE